MLSAEEVAAVCQQLGDGVTLENLPRPQLVSICRYMGINAFGTDAFLRYQIRKRMERLHADDLMIHEEGVTSLTTDELRAACLARGIRTVGVSEAKMQKELGQWLELHVNRQIPAIMLILSRVFSLIQEESGAAPEAALQAAIMSLPEHVVEEAELQASEAAGSAAVSPKQKLQVLEQQQEMIAEELLQEEKVREVAKDEVSTPRPITPEKPSSSAAVVGQEADGLTREQIEDLSEAISVLSSHTPADQERRELQDLLTDRAGYKEEIAQLSEQLQQGNDAGDGTHANIPKAARVVGAKLDSLIQDIGQELTQYEEQVGSKLHLIQANQRGELTTAQLELILGMLRKAPKDDAQIAAILRRFDEDGDGRVLLSEILRKCEEQQELEGQGVLLQDEKKPTETK